MFLRPRSSPAAAAVVATPLHPTPRRHPGLCRCRFVIGFATAVAVLVQIDSAQGVDASKAVDAGSASGDEHSLRGRFANQQEGLLPLVTDAEGEDFFGRRSRDGTGQIGDDCYTHDFCASGLCSSGIFSSGSCVECLSHDDCEGHGHSLPGTLPEAFCYEAEGEYPVCSRWKNGRPIGERGYPMWLGHEDVPPIWIRRKMFEGPPTSVVWRIDVNNQIGGAELANKFEANATHVRIPLRELLLAGYSMSNPMVQEHETGVVTMSFAPNPRSIVTPFAQSWTDEKYHTLTYDGPMDDSHKRRVEAELEARTSEENEEAVRLRKRRARYMALAIAAVSLNGMLVEQGQDVIALDQLRSYARQLKNGDAPPKNIMHTEMSTEAAEATELAKTLPSLKSMNQCTHFEETDAVRLTESHLEFPLDLPIMTVKGITEFIPSHYFGTQGGLTSAHYDAEAGVLEFHLEMTQSGRLYPYEPTSPKNGLWLGSNDDATAPSEIDGRSDEFYSDDIDYAFVSNHLFRRFMSKPIDYTSFDSPSGTCDEETAEDMSPLWSPMNFDEGANLFNRATRGVQKLRLISEGMTCGSNFLKGDAHEGLVGIDFLEMAVWGHMVTENADSTRESMMTATWHDDWDAFYKAQAKAL